MWQQMKKLLPPLHLFHPFGLQAVLVGITMHVCKLYVIIITVFWLVGAKVIII
jgi:hypothetical protein